MRFKLSVTRACWFCILQALLACVLAGQSAFGAPSMSEALGQFKARHYAQALPLFQNYARSNPQDALARYYCGLCYQYMNQMTLATEEYKWVAAYSKNPQLKAQAENGLAGLSRYSRSYGGSAQAASSTNVASASGGRTFAKGRLKVMEFYTDWCGVCKKFAPVFESVRSNYGGRCDFQQLNAEDPGNEKIVQRYQIGAYPTTIFADSSGAMVNRLAGSCGEDALKSLIDNSLQQVK
ncbi:MAG: hypothetical protein K2W82_03950 [Candidatus Obscuribacterales bacterium]|nr:hypothetical protein [Candidatus Obscuribacterales bacterium]